MNALDFDDDRHLEQELAAAAMAFSPPAGLQDAMRSRLFGQSAQRALQLAGADRGVGGRRRWIVWAIAASLLMAGWLVLNRSETKLLSVAYAELAAAIEKADQAEWVHYFEGNREEWVSFRPYRYFMKSSDRIMAWDRPANRQYDYDRKSNTLTVRCMGAPGDMEIRGSFAEIIRQKIAGLEEEGKEVHKGTEEFVGKTATVYVVTGFRANEGGKFVKLKYFFDTQTDRLLGIEGSGTGWLSWFKYRMVVDYPAECPNDVYALGVPRDATISEQTPPREVVELIQKVDEAAAREPKQLYQISVEAYESFSQVSAPNFGIWVEVTSVRDGRLRRDRYGVRRATDYEQSLQDLAKFRKEVVERGIEAVEAWLKDRKPVQILFGDMRSGKITVYRLARAAELTREPWASTIIVQELARPWGRRAIFLEGTTSLLKEREGPWGTLVGIEEKDGQSNAVRSYFNPQRDYVCERRETDRTDDNENVEKVLEYGRTADGHWFAKSARVIAHNGRDTILVTNFRDDGRVLESQLFDESQITAVDLSAE